MKKSKIDFGKEAVLLRQKAEELLIKKQSKKSPLLTEIESIKLMYELEVHQIELEMQNEELQLAKEKAESNAEKYTNLYDFAPFGYFTLNGDGEICELNFSGAKMISKERSKLINCNFNLFVAPENRIVFVDFLKRILVSKTKQSCEVRLDINEKLPVFVHIEGILLQNEMKYLLTVVDISKIKQTEIKLKKAKKKAEKRNQLKSVFLANMSHEIRTPMNGILGFADLLKEPNLSGTEQQNYIKIIEESGARMLNIINDIISITKIESGSMEVNIKESNINEQIENIYSFFKPEVESKGIQFSFKNDFPNDASFVNTDKEKLFAILTNLVKNAIKYTDSGEIEFGYTKKVNHIEFYVSDTGIGIADYLKKTIFERFIQADSSDVRAFQGAGLGLSITKAYVEMLGGKIWVENKVGKGSIFYFTLPYQRCT
jgi:signal transduction histidine kinase